MSCIQESYNECDRYAVVIHVVKDGVIVGLLSKAVSRICSLFPHTCVEMTELHVLSNSIIFELILSFEKFI